MIGDDDLDRARRLGETAPPLSAGQARAVRRIILATYQMPWGGDRVDVLPPAEIVERESRRWLANFDTLDEAEEYLSDLGYEPSPDGPGR